MAYLSVKEWAEKYGVSERTARNYCSLGKLDGVYLVGKTWQIPADAVPPGRKKAKAVSPLLKTLREQKSGKLKGGIYHRIQIDLTYNSNHIEGSRLTHDQTRYIFETNAIGMTDKAINIDDIIETTNHFRAIDYIIDNTDSPLTESYIKHLHLLLKSGTSDADREWFNVGEYKRLPNEVGGNDTTAPEDVSREIKSLLQAYNSISRPTFEDILDFHHRFESIHPFQDGNGRVGRLLLFKECLRNNIVPFIITDDLKMFYYRGLHEWKSERGYLLDTCLTAQDQFKSVMEYFRIPY